MSRRRHVVLVSSTAGSLGHSTLYLDRLVEGLAARDYPVTTVTASDYAPSPDTGGPLDAVRVPVEAAMQRADRFAHLGPFASAARGVARLRMSRRILGASLSLDLAGAVVHFVDHEYVALTRTLSALHTRRVRTAVTLHASDFDGSTGGLGRVYKSLVRPVLARELRRSSALFTHGPWIEHRIAEQMRIDRSRPPPLLTSRYYPSDGYGPLAFTAPRPVGRPVNLLWFGMIRRNKRLELALAALRRLPPDFHLHVAGSPAELTEREIREMVARAEVSGRVSLTLEYVHDDEADRMFGEADLLLLTHDSRFTSASGPVADARCYGLPVVVPRAGQLSEYVERLDVGVVADGDTPEHISAAVVRATDRLAGEPEWRGAILDVARGHDWDAFTEHHAKVYSSLPE